MGNEGPFIKVQVGSQEEIMGSQYEREWVKALEYLDKYNKEFKASLLKTLNDEFRRSLYNDLGGSFYDILGDTPNITETEEALNEYAESMSMEGRREEKFEKMRQAVKKLKASVRLE